MISQIFFKVNKFSRLQQKVSHVQILTGTNSNYIKKGRGKQSGPVIATINLSKPSAKQISPHQSEDPTNKPASKQTKTCYPTGSTVIHLQRSPIANLVIGQGDVILKRVVPLLEHNLLRRSPYLRRHQPFKVTDRIIRFAFYAHFFAEAVVADYFDHGELLGISFVVVRWMGGCDGLGMAG
jgi:hypothetical protein